MIQHKVRCIYNEWTSGADWTVGKSVIYRIKFTKKKKKKEKKRKKEIKRKIRRKKRRKKKKENS